MLEYSDYIIDWPDMPYPNFIAWLEGIETQWQDKTALLYRSGKQKEFTTWSFNKLASESRRIGRGLLAAGLTKGDRVVLWAENRPEWLAVWLGAAVAGLVVVPVDFLVSEQECFNILQITKAKAFFYSAKNRNLQRPLKPRGLRCILLLL
jgi:long-chain acyl-CoA synthetase